MYFSMMKTYYRLAGCLFIFVVVWLTIFPILQNCTKASCFVIMYLDNKNISHNFQTVTLSTGGENDIQSWLIGFVQSCIYKLKNVLLKIFNRVFMLHFSININFLKPFFSYKFYLNFKFIHFKIY